MNNKEQADDYLEKAEKWLVFSKVDPYEIPLDTSISIANTFAVIAVAKYLKTLMSVFDGE